MASPRVEIFQTLAWARASWRARGAGRRLASVAVFRGAEPVGLLPLAARHDTLAFLGAPGADYADLLGPPAGAAAALEAAFEALLAWRGIAWHRLVLRNVPADGNLARARAALPPRLRARTLRTGTTPCPTLALGPDREAQLEALAAKESLRRHEAKLRRRGEVVFRHLETRAEIRAALPDFFLQHERRRAVTGSASQFHSPVERAFYEALVEELDPAGELRFAVLEVAGRPAAYHFGFEYARKLVWYKPTFDVDLWDEGPGEVLLRHLLLYCRGAAVNEFDFTVGGEAFKSRFANRVRENLDLVFERSAARALGRRLVLGAKGGARRRWPGPWARLREARASVPRFLRCFLGALYRRDEVIVFVRPCGGPRPSGGAPSAGSSLTLRAGGLSDLADLAIAHPAAFGRRKLEAARARLRRGDELHLALEEGRVVHVAWVGTRASLDLSYEVGPGSALALERPAPVIFDCWTPPAARGRGFYTRMLRHLAGRAASSGAVYVYASASNPASCRGIVRAGFAPWRRLSRTRVLGISTGSREG